MENNIKSTGEDLSNYDRSPKIANIEKQDFLNFLPEDKIDNEKVLKILETKRCIEDKPQEEALQKFEKLEKDVNILKELNNTQKLEDKVFSFFDGKIIEFTICQKPSITQIENEGLVDLDTKLEATKIDQNTSEKETADFRDFFHNGVKNEVKISETHHQDHRYSPAQQEFVQLYNEKSSDFEIKELEISENELQEFAIFKEENISTVEHTNNVTNENVSENFIQQDFECNMCHNNFELKESLKQHNETVHEGTYPCSPNYICAANCNSKI